MGLFIGFDRSGRTGGYLVHTVNGEQRKALMKLAPLVAFRATHGQMAMANADSPPLVLAQQKKTANFPILMQSALPI
jgi:hypothetical protein